MTSKCYTVGKVEGIENKMNNFDEAKELFKTGNYSCVLCKDGTAYTSTKRGVAPLLEWVTQDVDLKGFSAADKIVGKAAAFLFVTSRVKEVYASVMSKTAIDILSQYGISAEYETLVQIIVNRSGTGPCPMEQAVAAIDEPLAAIKAIQNTLADLQSKGKNNIK